MHIQVQLRTESFELCVFDCYVVLLCSWDVPDKLITCALEIKRLKTTGAGDTNKDKEASQFTFIFIFSFPCRWSFANFTRCSCHRKAKSSRVDMDREGDSVMEMNRPTWWELVWTLRWMWLIRYTYHKICLLSITACVLQQAWSAFVEG